MFKRVYEGVAIRLRTESVFDLPPPPSCIVKSKESMVEKISFCFDLGVFEFQWAAYQRESVQIKVAVESIREQPFTV